MSDATMYAHKNPGVRLDGGPAFPFAYPAATDAAVYGMTLRDYFAASALQGYRAYGAWQIAIGSDGHPSEQRGRPATPEAAARWSYADADAMLAQRDK